MHVYKLNKLHVVNRHAGVMYRVDCDAAEFMFLREAQRILQGKVLCPYEHFKETVVKPKRTLKRTSPAELAYFNATHQLSKWEYNHKDSHKLYFLSEEDMLEVVSFPKEIRTRTEQHFYKHPKDANETLPKM